MQLQELGIADVAASSSWALLFMAWAPAEQTEKTRQLHRNQLVLPALPWAT
jgi:hypothetical protein